MLNIHQYHVGPQTVIVDSFDVFSEVFSTIEVENLRMFFEAEGRSGVERLRRYITNNLSVSETIAVEDEFVEFLRTHINPNVNIDDAIELLQNRRW